MAPKKGGKERCPISMGALEAEALHQTANGGGGGREGRGGEGE